VRLSLGFAFLVLPAHADDGRSSPARLTGLSLEELLRIEIVHAATRRDVQPSQAPSSVTVVSADEIRRLGLRTLADVLRSASGFYVTDDRNYSYVGVRGFGIPGDYNTRILVLIDGFRLNDAIYDMAPVGQDFPIDMELVERVEVVRGPGASVYGNSAFFAVVNVVTRRGRTVEGELAGAVGSFRTGQGRASWGGQLSNGLELLGSATLGRSDGERLYFPAFDTPETGGGVAAGLDDERVRSLYGSACLRGLCFFAADASREKGIPTAPYWTRFGDPHTRTWDRRTLAALKLEGRIGARWEGFARPHYGRYDYRGHYAYEDAEGGLLLDHSRGEWWGLDAALRSDALGRHRLTFGGELQHNVRQQQDWAYSEDPTASFEVRERSRRYALYGQDEITLAGSLVAHAGLRLDFGPASGNRASPRLGLVFSPKRTVLKLLYGTAFRAPNEYELHYYAATGPLEPETIRTLEAVAEQYLGRRLRLTAAVFDNHIERLITLEEAGDEALGFRNAGSARSRGVEAGLETKLWDDLRVRLAYSHQRTSDAETGAPRSNSPRHLLKLGLTGSLLEQRLTGGLDLQYTSSRLTLAGATLPSFAVANLTLRAPRAVGPIDASLSIYNLFDARYSDPASEEHVQDTLPQPRRSLLARLAWRF
jgi:iron complex outermembrane receptor protein